MVTAFQAGLLRRVRASKQQDGSDSVDGSSESEGIDKDYDSDSMHFYSKTEDPEVDTDQESEEDHEPKASSSSKDSDQDPDQDQPPDPTSLLSSISFADLATAQASLGPSRKRKHAASISRSSNSSRSPSPFHEAQERQDGKSKVRMVTNTRSSKHGPMEVSSKKAVSRKRTVVASTKVSARDPRFSDLSGGAVNTNRIAQNYAFLNDYRADEMQQIKAKLRSAKDSGARERLRAELRAMEDRERARKKVEEERAVVKEHRRKETEAVKMGKKPFFLKRADVKKQVLVKRFEDLGEKKVEKVMERKRKKNAARQRKAMPDSRREVG